MLQEAAARFELYAQQVTAAVCRRFVFAQNVPLPVTLKTRNSNADKHAREWAALIRALNRGEAELVGWTEALPERGPITAADLRLGIVKTGSLPKAVGVFPLIPVLVVAAGALASVGTWLVADAWTQAQLIEAEALKVDADNRATITAAITAAPTLADKQALAAAYEKANKAASAAQPASWLEQLKAIAGAGASSLGGLFDSPWLILVGLYLLSRGSKR
jgi:hypothetical protein